MATLDDQEPKDTSHHHGRDSASGTAVILTAFAHRGLRNTAQRQIMAAWLSEAATSGKDFSAEDMWKELGNRDKPVGRATVFRALDALEGEGLVDRVELPSGSRRYRVCGKDAHHHHIVCVTCGKVADVRNCLSGQLARAIADETGFTLERHSIDLFGRCEMCQGATAP